jgi:probable HAF family extracellular repeat protein
MKNTAVRSIIFAGVLTGAISAQSPTVPRTRYVLRDLGTFGGPASYLSNGYDGIVNNRGTAVGSADTANPDPFPGFCFNPDCYVSHAFRWDKGVIRDLGALPGGGSSTALSVSSNGFVAGISQNGNTDPLNPNSPENRAVLWQNGVITDLGTLEGGYESLATGVNNSAQVVGASNNTISDPFSMVGDGYQVRAFLWRGGTMQDLGTLGGPDAFALLINDLGQIAGQSYRTSTPNATTGIPTQDPFLWTHGTMIDLGTLGGTIGYPTALNRHGQVAGQSNLVGDTTFHPFLWDRGALKDLGTLGGDTGTANWINDAGEVVGKADLPPAVPQQHDAVLWRGGRTIDLGTISGLACSNAYYINSRGQIVGTSSNQQYCSMFVGQRAFLWEQGGPMIDLNTLIPANSSLELTYAVAINDWGEIAGFGVPPGVDPADYETKGHAYILIPCDANHGGTVGCDVGVSSAH